MIRDAPFNRIAYAPRQVVDCGILNGPWTAKLYAILAGKWDRADLPTASVLADTVRQAMGSIASPLDHPLGFGIFHLAEDGIYLLLTRFNNANNLRHRVFSVRMNAGSLELEQMHDPHIVACIWELRLMKFEVDVWIETVLKSGLTLEASQRYLDRRYAGTV